MHQRILLAATKITTEQIEDNYEGREGKFIKGFLMNDKRNKNGWRVTWEAIKKYSSDFINHPGIRYEEYGEPDHTDGRTYKENMVNQEGSRVVNIVGLIPDESTHTLNYVGEIIDDEFEQSYDAGEIDKTSPAIWPEEMKEVGKMADGRPELDVYKFRALHQAYIDDPAYEDAAATISTCDGDGVGCKIRLSAKTNTVELMAADLGPLMEVPLIRKILNSRSTPCEIKKYVDELAASIDSNDCVANKLKIIMADNPNMDKDQQLAIAYAYCKQEGIAELEALINS